MVKAKFIDIVTVRVEKIEVIREEIISRGWIENIMDSGKEKSEKRNRKMNIA